MSVNGEAGAHVLVVDDDAEFRALLSHLLRDVGHCVSEAATGQQALAIARAEEVDLVLLDICLPDISGYEICHQLRAIFGERLPLIFVSGARTEAYDRVGGLLLGADDYLSKPFAPDELLARVRRLLTRSVQADAARNFDLTRREMQVLGLLASGLGQTAIARQLVLTEKTVATHIQRILAKIGVHSRAEAVAFAHQHALSVPR